MEDKLIANFNPLSCIASKIQKSNRIINNIFRKHLKELKLSNSQVSMLFVLSKKKTITQKELAAFLYLEKSTVNRNLDRLIKQDLLFVNANQQIQINEKGLNKVKMTIPIWQEAMQEAEEKLGQKGLESLNDLIHSLTI